MNYHKLLLDELRLVVYEKGDAPLTEALLTKAVTLNENLKALGYTLSPADIAALAVSPSLALRCIAPHSLGLLYRLCLASRP